MINPFRARGSGLNTWPAFIAIVTAFLLVLSFVIPLLVVTQAIFSRIVNKKDKQIIALNQKIGHKNPHLKSLFNKNEESAGITKIKQADLVKLDIDVDQARNIISKKQMEIDEKLRVLKSLKELRDKELANYREKKLKELEALKKQIEFKNQRLMELGREIEQYKTDLEKMEDISGSDQDAISDIKSTD